MLSVLLPPGPPGRRQRVIGFLLGDRLEVGSSPHLGQLQVPGSHRLFPTWPGAFSPKE